MTFLIRPLPAADFTALFALDDAALAARGGRRVVADARPGFPCRVSLADAAIGETLLLVHHEHHAVDTPFRASHAIYVRKGAVAARPAPGEVPEALRVRLLSVRGYDAAGMMLAADAVEGGALTPVIEAMFADPAVAYVHLHFARPGCYAARVERVPVGDALVAPDPRV